MNNEAKKFEDAITAQTMATGALARLNIVEIIRSAERVFPDDVTLLKEWADANEGDLVVTMEDGEVTAELEDGWGIPLTGGIADGVRDWEEAVSQKLREMDPAAVLAAGWLEGAEGTVCHWPVSYTKKEMEEASTEAERLTKKAAELAAGLFD